MIASPFAEASPRPPAAHRSRRDSRRNAARSPGNAQPLHCEYAESGAPVLPPLIQRSVANDVYIAALRQGDTEYYPMITGQRVGLVRDLPRAAEAVETIIREARAVRSALPERIRQI